MKDITIVKVGGAIVERPAALQELLEQFTALAGSKVLVHGGGRSATQMASRLGIESRMVDGRRITDDDMLQVVTMVYGGLVNKNLAARLQALGTNALGLTGADMNLIRAHKRPPLPATVAGGSAASPASLDYGWVGDVDSADGARLAQLIALGLTPVIAPLTHDGQGHILNTNADTMAQTVACALAHHYQQAAGRSTAAPSASEASSASSLTVPGDSFAGLPSVTLTFAFEKAGVLLDPDDPDSAIPHLTPSRYEELKAQGVISGGMIPKLDNAFQALRAGVRRVVITSAADLRGEGGTIIEL